MPASALEWGSTAAGPRRCSRCPWGPCRSIENKTDDARAWALNPGVATTLRAWKAMRGDDVGDGDPVFVDEHGRAVTDEHMAERFRQHLHDAGVSREQLFEASATRRPTRVHDRATFITVALANDRTEGWIQDRTGHKSSQMINDTGGRPVGCRARPGRSSLPRRPNCGSACSSHATPGSNDVAVTVCVCAMDPYYCNSGCP